MTIKNSKKMSLLSCTPSRLVEPTYQLISRCLSNNNQVYSFEEECKVAPSLNQYHTQCNIAEQLSLPNLLPMKPIRMIYLNI